MENEKVYKCLNSPMKDEKALSDKTQELSEHR